MSRISRRFAALEKSKRRALIPFVTAGDPRPEVTVPLLHEMVAAGADVLELGVPFSDPMADGPVIQRASERALAQGICLHRVLGMVKEFREQDDETPVVLMGYLNPYEAMGYDVFAQAAGAAGVDGVLTVDLPPEEADEFVCALDGVGIDPIFLIAPTTTTQRVAAICARARGFVYYVSLKGVTGSQMADIDSIAAKITEIKAHTRLPVGVGFGIRDGASAARVARVSDAVVIGSILVQKLEELAHHPAEISVKVPALVAEIRAAMDAEGERI